MFERVKTKKVLNITIEFRRIDKIPFDPSYFVPQLHSDQLNISIHHLCQINGHIYNDCTHNDVSVYPQIIVKAKSSLRYSWRILKKN